MTDLQSKLDYADAVAEWFLEMGDAHGRAGRLEEATKCCHVAATILARQNRSLSSARLESNLRFIAERLDGQEVPTTQPDERCGSDTCLHVMSAALPAGGITSMVTRWIRNDRGRRHDLALLEQRPSIPDPLRSAVADAGGRIDVADPHDSMLRQAAWLRALARRSATRVILHINVADVVYAVAFGSNGGPPVFIVNYTAHAFWTGACIADLVLNVRGSALEQLWTQRHRGISRHAILPIPLQEDDPPRALVRRSEERKRRARACIGVPTDAVVIVTVGAYFKYLPTGTLDFLAACEEILRRVPQAHLLAVGFRPDDRWQAASDRMASRIRAVGLLSPSGVATVHEAADIYIEGFPFGTTTALLEAGLAAMPVVLAPAQCPPPFGSDGVALDATLQRPASVEDYVRTVVRLACRAELREREGERIREAIARHHTGEGWNAYLESAIARLPGEHVPQACLAPVRTAEPIHEYWAGFVTRISEGYEESCEVAVSKAVSMGLRPKLTSRALQAFRAHRSPRAGRSIPLPLLVFLCNGLLQRLPLPLAGRIFRLVAFLYRPRLARRLRTKLARLGLVGARPTEMYQEYRATQALPDAPPRGKGEASVGMDPGATS